MTNIAIPKNVLAILDKSARYIGRQEEEMFSQVMFTQINELGIESPIEQVMHIAFETVARLNWLHKAEPLDAKRMSPGLVIVRQHRIGPYMADFYLEWLRGHGEEGAKPFRSVVVECDGTAFHERTEDERRREKRRDRYMQKLDLKVFRYTGKEILEDPYQIAKEVLAYITDHPENTVTPEEYF